MDAGRAQDLGGAGLLRDAAYRHVRTRILSGAFRPGERLHDADIAAALGISRTPVREAMARLAVEGLTETSASRYTRVAPLSGASYAAAEATLNTLHAGMLIVDLPILCAADYRLLTDWAVGISTHDTDALLQSWAWFGARADQRCNDLIRSLEDTTQTRARFHLDAPDTHITWERHAATLTLACINRLDRNDANALHRSGLSQSRPGSIELLTPSNKHSRRSAEHPPQQARRR